MADALKEAVDKSISALLELINILSDVPVSQQSVSLKETTSISDEFSQLKEMLYSDKWPEAVSRNLICDPDSEKDKLDRGRGIIELMIEEDINGLKILDFGCGEGQCAFVSTEYGTSMSVGYDIKEDTSWNNYQKHPNLIMTSNWNEVVANGPYDIVVLFDVVDHLKGETPEVIMNKIQSILKSGGKVYMRCHPWISRHGTHIYYDINKAYVHIIFNENELKEIVPESKFNWENLKVTKPIMTYNLMVEQAQFKIVNRRDITEKVESFFKTPLIANRIKRHTEFNDFPEFQMSLQFLDYVLEKP